MSKITSISYDDGTVFNTVDVTPKPEVAPAPVVSDTVETSPAPASEPTVVSSDEPTPTGEQ